MRSGRPIAAARNRGDAALVETNRIDDKGVALPSADRVAVCGGFELLGVRMFPSVGVDITGGRWRARDHADHGWTLADVQDATIVHDRRHPDVDAAADRFLVLRASHLERTLCGGGQRRARHVEAVEPQLPVAGKIRMRGRGSALRGWSALLNLWGRTFRLRQMLRRTTGTDRE